MLLGKEIYNKLLSEGAFFLLYEFALKWKKIFFEYFKFPTATLREFMRDMHSKIVYLDTGVQPVPNDILHDIEETSSLKVEIWDTSLIFFKQTLLTMLKEV
jgi:hypothetical protein